METEDQADIATILLEGKLSPSVLQIEACILMAEPCGLLAHKAGILAGFGSTNFRRQAVHLAKGSLHSVGQAKAGGER
jgi:hypothetical protein